MFISGFLYSAESFSYGWPQYIYISVHIISTVVCYISLFLWLLILFVIDLLQVGGFRRVLTKNSFSRTNVTIHTNYNTNTLVCFTWVIDIRRYDHNLNRDKIQKCKCKTPKYMAVKIFASSVGGGGGLSQRQWIIKLSWIFRDSGSYKI